MPKADNATTTPAAPPLNTVDPPGRRAILAGSGLALAALALAEGASAASASGANRPDADLIQACAHHAINLRACNGGESTTEDPDARAAYEKTRDLIGDAEPQTMAGILAKCRAARDEATDGGYDEEWEGSMGAVWAIDVVNDLLRLAAAGAA
jgi:hypothetical protein